MKKVALSLAVLLTASSLVFAGIEVLRQTGVSAGIEVLSVTDPGHTLVGEVYSGGAWHMVDSDQADAQGMAELVFPGLSANQARIRDIDSPGIEVLYIGNGVWE